VSNFCQGIVEEKTKLRMKNANGGRLSIVILVAGPGRGHEGFAALHFGQAACAAPLQPALAMQAPRTPGATPIFCHTNFTLVVLPPRHPITHHKFRLKKTTGSELNLPHL
jgi:hypothetical protein